MVNVTDQLAWVMVPRIQNQTVTKAARSLQRQDLLVAAGIPWSVVTCPHGHISVSSTRAVPPLLKHKPRSIFPY